MIYGDGGTSVKIYEHEQISILEIQREITIKNVYQFKETMVKFLENSGHQLILDLNDVTYLNSSALGIIAETAINANKDHKELIVAGVKPPIDEIFEIVKFRLFMKLFPNLQKALDYYG